MFLKFLHKKVIHMNSVFLTKAIGLKSLQYAGIGKGFQKA